MGLLKSVDNVPGIDYYEYRETDYWGKFKYRARIAIPVSRTLHYATNIDEWKSRIATTCKWSKLSNNEKKLALSKENLVSNFLSFRENLKKNKTGNIRIEGNTVAVFSNDLQILQTIKTWDANVTVDFTEVILGQYSGVKYFVRQPKNNFRIYFRSKRIESTSIEQLKDLLERQKSLKPSKCLSKWLNGKHKTMYRYKYLSASFFIDYDDESMLSYLALCHGDMLGKKYKLEKRI